MRRTGVTLLVILLLALSSAGTMQASSVNASLKTGIGLIEEEAIYRVGGHDSVGTTEPSRTWYLAEGSTGGSFETWVLIQNPGEVAADIELTFMTPDGMREGPTDRIPPMSRRTYNVADTLPGQYSVSTRVTSNQDVVAERAMYWQGS